MTIVTGREGPGAGSGATWKRAVRRVLNPASRAGLTRDQRDARS